LSDNVLDPVSIPYEVRKGIPPIGGNGGTLVCHGKKPGTLVDTGITDWYNIYATIVSNIKGCRLPAGKYWMSVVPYCNNTQDDKCGDYRGFVVNDDGAMNHRYGPLEPANDSFFNSVFFGANWEPTSYQQTSARFSVGVEGTEK
jgi:hypothetical protein